VSTAWAGKRRQRTALGGRLRSEQSKAGLSRGGKGFHEKKSQGCSRGGGRGKTQKDHKPSDLEGFAQIINVHMSIITL
jgi:hypothetical protein